jgi:hypothetical protein
MPISPGNTYVVFTYDGVDYELPYANVTSYDQRPVYAEDNYTLNRYETTVQGSCVVSDATNTFVDLATKFRMGTGRVDRVRVSVTASGGTENLIDVSYPDTMNGPLLHLTATEINGRQACLVTFAVQAATAHPSSSGTPDPAWPIISNRWTQRFSLDAAGLITRTISGVATINLAATGTSSTVSDSPLNADITGRYPWADLFRRAILPAQSSVLKFRRESQTFAYNEAGNQLIYEITDVQARTELPDGAYAGTAEFSYERTRQGLAWGVLRFSCELEGEADGDTRALVNAAVQLSRSRLDFSRCIIERLVLTELTLLKKAHIKFEIDAKAPATDVNNPTGSLASVPMANVIGRFFTVSRTCDWKPDPYGNGGVFAQPHWELNPTSAKPDTIPVSALAVADIIDVLTVDCPIGATTITFVGVETAMTAANAAIDVGPYSQPLAQFVPSPSDVPTILPGAVISVEKQISTTITDTDSGVHRLQTMYDQGSDFLFQARKASADIVETTTLRKVNSPPARVFRPMPAGFFLVKETWRVTHGDVDSSGNRTFTGIWERTTRAYDTGGVTSNGYATDGTYRRWWPPLNTVTAAYAQGYSSSDQVSTSSVLALPLSDKQTYGTGAYPGYS